MQCCDFPQHHKSGYQQNACLQQQQLAQMMASPHSSYMRSSTSSFKNTQPNLYPHHLMRMLNNSRGVSYQREESPVAITPIVRRNISQNTFGYRAFSPKYEERGNTFHNRFFQSRVESTPNSKINLGEYNNLQKSITDYAAKEISLQTEKDLLKKEIKRLKEEIAYLNEKSLELQKKNQKLMKYKSRAQIFSRQYQKLMREFNILKEKYCRYEYQYEPSHVPLSLEEIEKGSGGNEIRGKEVASRLVPEQMGAYGVSKISWKKVSGGNRQLSKKYPSVTPYDDLPLLESRVESSNNQDQSSNQSRPEARTIDLKDFQRSRSRQFQKKCQQLEQQLMQIRRKNISLYKKCEQAQKQKLKYLQSLTEMKYQKSKHNTAVKDRENNIQKDMEKLALEKETHVIKVMELQEKISSDESIIKLLKLEKSQLEEQLLSVKGKLEAVSKDSHNQYEEKYKEIQKKYEKVAEEFDKVRVDMLTLSRKNQQHQIEKKYLEKQLQEKKELISQLEKQIMSKNSNYQGNLDQQSNPSNSEPIFQLNKLMATPSNNPQINTLIHQISLLRQENTKYVQERQFLQAQLDSFKKENHFLTDNYTKLTRIFEHQKQQNIKLTQLRQSWRQIQNKAKLLKRIDTAVEHLWQIKQVEYDNVHNILNAMHEERPLYQ